MFPFKKPPSRAEVARETVVSTVSDALDSLSHHAHDWIESAHDLIEGTLESAHDKLEIVGAKLEATGETIGGKVEDAVEVSPLDKAKLAATAATAAGAATVAGAAEKLGALGAGAATGAVGILGAGKSVADKVGEGIAAVREPAAPAVPQNVPNVKRARKQAQAEINTMNKEAIKYKRELEQELARDQQLFAAEQARMQREYKRLQADLEAAHRAAIDEQLALTKRQRRAASDEQLALTKRQRKADEDNDIVRVPISPTDEVVAVDSDGDGDYEYRDPDYQPQQGGGNGWLIFGGILLAGAGAVYYLFSSTDGKRKRAAIQDRVTQVADGVREKVAQNSDATGDPEVEEVAEAATEASDRSNEKIADDETVIVGIDAKLPPTTTGAASASASATGASGPGFPDKAVDKIEEVGDKVADGIAGAGAFLADKLEAAGAGAKSAAHSAAEKLDDAKGKTAAKIDEARKPVLIQAPDATVVKATTQELPQGETTEEILAEVEETVRNIEDSVRDEKK